MVSKSSSNGVESCGILPNQLFQPQLQQRYHLQFLDYRVTKVLGDTDYVDIKMRVVAST